MIKRKQQSVLHAHAPSKCPVCFEIFDIKTIQLRCLNQFGYCAEEPDPKLASFFNLPREMTFARIVPNGVSTQKEGMCDQCQSSTERICPGCHSTLPLDFPLENPKNILLFGSRACGKSTYLSVLTKGLFKNSDENLDHIFECRDETSLGILNDLYHDPLFGRRESLAPTRPVHQNPTLLQPLITRFQSLEKVEKGEKQKVCSISFFDASGQDLEERNFTPYRKRLVHADAIIFFIDVDSLQEDPNAHQSNSTFNLEVHALLNLLREQATMPSIAFVVSKLDTFVTLLPKRSPLMRSGLSKEGYKDEDSASLSYEIQGYLGAWYGTNVMKVIENNFPHHRFFALSSLGYPPENGKLDIIAPHRVEDPLAWLLNSWKL